METVNRLKSILTQHDIETEEHWSDESCINTHCIRLTIKGTDIGTNGKGVSKEFALASAYAEFFERLQNEMLLPASVSLGKLPLKITADEKTMTSIDIAESNNAFMKLYFSERNSEKASVIEKANAFKSVQRLDFILSGNEDCYATVPFYSVRKQSVEYLPRNIYRFYYGSNGMSAGNIPEEALVQGIAEIIERFVQKKLFLEKPSLPDIPEEYIAKFPYVYDMFKKLKKNKGYVYMLKDCSMGGKYPVAALIILEKNTGKYGIKLGCHPDFGVAMERAFTEAAQGQDILQYSNRSEVDFKNSKVNDRFNIYNSYKVGLGQYPYQILGKDPTYPFVQAKDVSSMSNNELLKNWVNELMEDGYDIMIRDVSYLGFPSYHIIIPGLSEMVNVTDDRVRVYNTRFHITALLSDPKKINKSNSKYIIGTMEFFLGSLMENTMDSYYPIIEGIELPCEDIGCGCIYMIAMCHILNENYEDAAKKMKLVVAYAGNYKVEEKRKYLYDAMYSYLSAMVELKSHEKAMEYMEILFDEDIYIKIDELFKEPEKIIVKQYPVINCNDEENNRSNNKQKIISYSQLKLKAIQAARPIIQEDIGLIFQQ
nr:YcaO-like family protein [Clostridium gasigenes]